MVIELDDGEIRIRTVVEAAMTSVNLGEVVGHLARDGGTEGDIRRILDPLPFERVPFGEDLANTAGLLVPATRAAGLSFGGRACLALARRLGVRTLTADRIQANVAPVIGVALDLIR